MEMLYCPNCGKLTGFKRALGFGTLFMVVLTLGLWLLVIPMYPPRCINCGLRRNVAFWKNVERVGFFRALTPSTVIGILGVVAVVLLLFTWMSSPSPERRTPAPIVKGPDYNESSPPMATTVNSVPQMDNPSAPEPGSALAVEAGALLASFQDDEDAAQSKYEGRRVAVTGALTGVFVPPPGQVIKMAEKGLAATAFVTMGGPRIASPEESLMLPGITAYSEDGSLFGQQTVLAIRVGQVLTLVCRCNGGHRALATVAGPGPTYSVLLKDCTFEAPGDVATVSVTRLQGWANASALGFKAGELPRDAGTHVAALGLTQVDGCRYRKSLSMTFTEYVDCKFLGNNGESIEETFYYGQLQRIDYKFGLAATTRFLTR